MRIHGRRVPKPAASVVFYIYNTCPVIKPRPLGFRFTANEVSMYDLLLNAVQTCMGTS